MTIWDQLADQAAFLSQEQLSGADGVLRYTPRAGAARDVDALWSTELNSTIDSSTGAEVWEEHLVCRVLSTAAGIADPGYGDKVEDPRESDRRPYVYTGQRTERHGNYHVLRFGRHWVGTRSQG